MIGWCISRDLFEVSCELLEVYKKVNCNVSGVYIGHCIGFEIGIAGVASRVTSRSPS